MVVGFGLILRRPCCLYGLGDCVLVGVTFGELCRRDSIVDGSVGGVVYYFRHDADVFEDGSPEEVISGFVDRHKVHGDGGGLSDAVDSVFGLEDLTSVKDEFGKDDLVGPEEVDARVAGSDGEDGGVDSGLGVLEALDEFVACGFGDGAIDIDDFESELRQEPLEGLEHGDVVCKDDEGSFEATREVVRIGAGAQRRWPVQLPELQQSCQDVGDALSVGAVDHVHEEVLGLGLFVCLAELFAAVESFLDEGVGFVGEGSEH